MTAGPDVPEQPDQTTETPSDTGKQVLGDPHGTEDAADAVQSALPGSGEDLGTGQSGS